MKTWLRIGIPVMAMVLLVIAVIGVVMPVKADYTSQRPADVITSAYGGACGGSCMGNDGDGGITCPNSDNGVCYGQGNCPGGGITGRGMMGRGTGTAGGGASCH
jgi:hypothetical protein